MERADILFHVAADVRGNLSRRSWNLSALVGRMAALDNQYGSDTLGGSVNPGVYKNIPLYIKVP